MLLIADSGSSKTDWLLSQPDGSFLSLKSQGLNPYVVLPEDFNYVVRNTVSDYIYDVTHVKFYGSGCTREMIPQVEGYLKRIFFTAEVHVYSDLVAAAHASLGREKGIIAILGTGSNSGLYDGKEIVQNVPSLGYILGDEGSGTWIGKRLLRDYLRGGMPAELRHKLEAFEPVQLDVVLANIYKMSSPNSYLAKFTHFIKENIEHEYCKSLVKRGFTKFIQQSLMKYEHIEENEVGVIGSIADVFSDILSETFLENGIEKFRIVKSPMDGLKAYYEQE